MEIRTNPLFFYFNPPTPLLPTICPFPFQWHSNKLAEHHARPQLNSPFPTQSPSPILRGAPGNSAGAGVGRREGGDGGVVAESISVSCVAVCVCVCVCVW